MTPTLYWMQSGGCGGDTMALLNADSPNIIEAKESLDFDLFWHPSFSYLTPADHAQLLDDLTGGTKTVTSPKVVVSPILFLAQPLAEVLDQRETVHSLN